VTDKTDRAPEAGHYGGPGRTGAAVAPDVAPAPSGRTLLKATLVALVVAGIVLVVAVLPAEYGIDPTGVGRTLGLMDLFAAGGEEEAAAGPATVTPGLAGPVFPQIYEYRVDTREFTIEPGTGMEFKYELDKGASMLYSWKASGFVDYDFHTEPEGKPSSESDSFDKGVAAQKRGAYTAPYNGIHGWYWENTSNRPVTVTLNTAGFYEEGRLFLPRSPAQTIEIPQRPGVTN
jgi:hypothetical protein